jgi:hypothetical protein
LTETGGGDRAPAPPLNVAVLPVPCRLSSTHVTARRVGLPVTLDLEEEHPLVAGLHILRLAEKPEERARGVPV